jgi:hypothetical protein
VQGSASFAIGLVYVKAECFEVVQRCRLVALSGNVHDTKTEGVFSIFIRAESHQSSDCIHVATICGQVQGCELVPFGSLFDPLLNFVLTSAFHLPSEVNNLSDFALHAFKHGVVKH